MSRNNKIDAFASKYNRRSIEAIANGAISTQLNQEILKTETNSIRTSLNKKRNLRKSLDLKPRINLGIN